MMMMMAVRHRLFFLVRKSRQNWNFENRLQVMDDVVLYFYNPQWGVPAAQVFKH